MLKKKRKKKGGGGNILKEKGKKREQHRVLSTSTCDMTLEIPTSSKHRTSDAF